MQGSISGPSHLCPHSCTAAPISFPLPLSAQFESSNNGTIQPDPVGTASSTFTLLFRFHSYFIQIKRFPPTSGVRFMNGFITAQIVRLALTAASSFPYISGFTFALNASRRSEKLAHFRRIQVCSPFDPIDSVI